MSNSGMAGRAAKTSVLALGLSILATLFPWYAAPVSAEPPLCALEIWTEQTKYLPGEEIKVSALLKVGDRDLPGTRIKLRVEPPQGPALQVAVELAIQLTRGVEWQGFLLALPMLGQRRDRSGIGPYELWANVEDRATAKVYCEARATFSIESLFIRRAQTKTLIITSARTEVVEKFASDLAAWLEATYRTQARILYDGDPLLSYGTGEFKKFDVIIYYGLEFYAPPSAQVVEDLFSADGIQRKKVVWLGYHIDRVQGTLLNNVGLAGGEVSTGNSTESLLYLDANESFRLANPDRVFVQVTDSRIARARATLKDKTLIASARHRQHTDSKEYFYYFGFHPTSYVVSLGGHLVFLDLLNEAYGIERPRVALIRIEDVHAKRSAFDVLSITTYLKDQGVPFTLGVIPIYVNGKERIALSENRDFRVMIKRALLDGGELVVHGATHQSTGETAVDYEFWDAKANKPIGGADYARERVNLALREIKLAGLALPTVAWETPHTQASLEHYSVFEEYFALLYEGFPYFGLREVPYVAEFARNTYVPGSLGYVERDEDVPRIIEGARKLMGLKYGAVAAFFYHPYLGLDDLRPIIQAMKAQGWKFVAVSSLAESVNVKFP